VNQTIAHAINNYLGLSETFIYSYLTNLKRYKPIVLTTQVTNLEQFPFRPIYDCSKISRYSWWWFRDRLGYYLYLNKKEYFEHILYFKHVLIKRWLKLPLITTFYGFDLTQLSRENIWNKAYQRLFKEGDLFLVEGNNMKQSLMGIGCSSEKIVIQHIGVDTEKIHFKERPFPSNGRVTILFCGRFVEKKGLIYALQALKLLISKHSQIELRVIGDGILRDIIEAFIHENNLSSYVCLLGYQTHCVFLEELKRAHIYIQPSVTAQNGDSEGGAPTTLLEAQASGVPVLSTYHADIPEVVVNGKSGFLVPERDAHALAERLQYLIEHSGEWLIMGKEGRRHVEMNYTIYKETENLENIYDTLIRK